MTDAQRTAQAERRALARESRPYVFLMGAARFWKNDRRRKLTRALLALFATLDGEPMDDETRAYLLAERPALRSLTAHLDD